MKLLLIIIYFFFVGSSVSIAINQETIVRIYLKIDSMLKIEKPVSNYEPQL